MLIILKTLTFFLILHIGNVWSYQSFGKHGPKPTPYHDWDYLMFSQRWPITSCSQWEESKPDNTCSLPSDRSQWTIHGIWPTKIGQEGPFFCPSAIHFDPGQLDPFMNDLKEHWTNVEANTKLYSFWKHEWDKHGTCSSTLPALDSVTNFFTQGLAWQKQFKLADILEQSRITPRSTGYTPEQIFDAVKFYTKVDPIVQCVTDRISKDSMISEIRICFNKTFELIDCDHTNPINKMKGSILSNCNLKKPVMYLATVPTNDISYQLDYADDALKQHYEEQMYYVGIYRLFYNPINRNKI
ncbi:hypothetical protein JTB14_033438 [Gonioctena quinquepunctata]|nr:hypothetical protein JTB14_033438 [Gonioctena quinquepunctata]